MEFPPFNKAMVTAQFRQLCASRALSKYEMLRANLNLTDFYDHNLEALILSLTSCVAANAKGSVDIEEKWPLDWWQAFRERWAPGWWLRRHPVRYKTISVHQDIETRICPHLDIKQQSRHVEWLCADQLFPMRQRHSDPAH